MPLRRCASRGSGLREPLEPVHEDDDIVHQSDGTAHDDADGDHILDWAVVEVIGTYGGSK